VNRIQLLEEYNPTEQRT